MSTRDRLAEAHDQLRLATGDAKELHEALDAIERVLQWGTLSDAASEAAEEARWELLAELGLRVRNVRALEKAVAE